MTVLGLNAYHGDASVALVHDGQLVAAIEEERLNRQKHCAGFPVLTARAVFDQVSLSPTDLAHVGMSRTPRAKLLGKALFALRHPGARLFGRVKNLRQV